MNRDKLFERKNIVAVAVADYFNFSFIVFVSASGMAVVEMGRRKRKEIFQTTHVVLEDCSELVLFRMNITVLSYNTCSTYSTSSVLFYLDFALTLLSAEEMFALFTKKLLQKDDNGLRKQKINWILLLLFFDGHGEEDEIKIHSREPTVEYEYEYSTLLLQYWVR